MSSADDDAVISGLRLQQFAPWLGSVIQKSFAEDVYHAVNLTNRSVFLYRITDGHVALLQKPNFKIRDTFNDSSVPEPEGKFIYREEFIRANMYRDFFQRILKSSRRAIDILVAVDVNDTPLVIADAPVFTFQKVAGSSTVLIPDVDFLHSNFYIQADYYDNIPYADKISRAIFAGSTTSGRTITVSDVKAMSIPRLRAAMRFKGSQEVDFRIPRIVQYASEDVAAMIADLGINATPCSWQDQFKYRFLLSMDGNGATCSRVVIGLLSQAVLAKYDSPHLLYYFGALVPWQHYVPITHDDDVQSIVETEHRHPMTFANVALEGRRFAQRYLGRAGVCKYTAELLSLYQSCLSRMSIRPEPEVEIAQQPLALFELGAHIQGVGDVWGWPGEWVGEAGSGHAIEAIAIIPSRALNKVLSHRVMLNDGSLSDLAEAGGFCGSRGLDMPLRGFELHLKEEWGNRLTCSYSGHFMDGTQIGPLLSGELCCSPSGAKLEAFHVCIREVIAEERE